MRDSSWDDVSQMRNDSGYIQEGYHIIYVMSDEHQSQEIERSE